MKTKILSIIALCLASATASAQVEEVDTIQVIPNAERVTILREGDITTVRAITKNEMPCTITVYEYSATQSKEKPVNGGKDPLAIILPFMKEKEKTIFRRHTSLTMFRNIYVGWNHTYGSMDGIACSYEGGIGELIGVRWHVARKTSFEMGVGIGTRCVSLKEGKIFAMAGDRLIVTDGDKDVIHDFAKWETFRLEFPLSLRQKVVGDWGFTLSVIPCLNTYSSATNQWKIDRSTFTQQITGLNQRFFTCDVMAGIGSLGNCGFYCRWSPMTAMEPQYGPEIKNVSVGLTVNF